ncbi:sigma-54 interaction domain-containing protein [Desulfovermiculus halophilus]|jgi:transcriptional regulator with PAS, ATPase and Fis domain|uniref:sigma-54 interaction domain-containing protein n=1 Tax=Desulfovermiculus halophilus TaxID=339722 RepID=UPI0004809610|nr:sigma-54-dependent Fis family transcriptional regulator [Desulfovermiculus halophilus]
MDENTETPQLYVHGLAEYPVPFSHLMNRIPVSVALLDRFKHIVFLNRSLEALTGVSSLEAKGIPCRHVLRSSLCGSHCPLAAMGVDAEPVCREGDIIDRNRERIPVRINFAPVVDSEGELAGWLESFEDLRATKAQEALRSEAYGFGALIGRSPQMEQIFQMVPGIAQTDSSVLITGETGTGKDILAEMIHQHSSRSKGSFVKVNCGALPETLLETELFGHRKGAFTGATENKPGRFRLAHNGTLFLTEIGDLPLSLQVKLLSFLDDHTIYPLGSAKGIFVDVRIVAATHRDLQAMVQEGKFRQDLLFRLNVVRLQLPPLRDREGDIQLLLDHFMRFFSDKFQKNIKGLSQESRNFLLHYPFPGNVRELRNIVEFAVNICTGTVIELRHLPVYMFDRYEEDGKTDSAPPSSEGEAGAQRIKPAAKSWPEMEQQMILDALYKAKGRKRRAAEILGWGRSTLWRKMKHYGIDS